MSRLERAEAQFLALLNIPAGSPEADDALAFFRASLGYQWLKMDVAVDRLWLPFRLVMRRRILRAQRAVAAMRDSAIDRYFRS